MRATLIHNAKAAGNRLSTEQIIELLREAGYDAEHRPTEGESELAAALRDPGDLVVVAGGDGTVRGVALALAGKPGRRVPLAIAPLGTANNIARTLSLTASTRDLILGLAAPQKRPFDLGLIRAPWGESRFLEAFGFGMFAQGLARYNPDERKSLFRAARAAIRTPTRYEAKAWRLELDDEDLSGRYLMVEAMNTAAMGLRLRLAPGADPGDGLFDVVLVCEDENIGMNSYLVKLTAGHLQNLSNVTVRRARRLRVYWDGSPVHFDEEIRGPDGGSVLGGYGGGVIEVEIQAGALELWLPQGAKDEN